MGKLGKIKGKLRLYIKWPLYLTLLLLVAGLGVYLISPQAGLLMVIVIIIYAAIAGGLYIYNKPSIYTDMVSFATQYGQIQKNLLKELAIPYVLLSEDGRIVWSNREFNRITGKIGKFNKAINTVFPELNQGLLPTEEEPVVSVNLKYGEEDYRVEMKRIQMDECLPNAEELIESEAVEGCLIALYLFDTTEINRRIRENEDQRMVVGLVYIDNYDEALENVEEVRSSLLVALIERKINKYFGAYDGIVRKLEKDRFFVVMQEKALTQIRETRFDLLQDIKTVNIGNEMAITLSIGIGSGGGSYTDCMEYARSAMDLALARGGDQAVVKTKDQITYYGGKTQQMEKNTRVKVRVKAHALRQILEANDNVLIMGHSLPDIDSFGSALGIYIIAKKFGKEAHIVFGEVSTSVRPFMNRFINKEEYPDDMFIKKDEVESYLKPSTVVIVVDVNRAQRTECPSLLDKCKTTIVFDHHRRSSDTITGAVLSYVDPYASSACEMVTEMIQYVDDGIKLKAFEADALYAGISIDTDGFNSKSGPRTFEAAAFLRRHGADVTRVRKMLRNDMDEYKAIASAVSKAEVYKDAFAITIFDGAGLESPTIGGAKAANQLLDISGIKASFVITAYEDKLYISARSIDEVNVQLVMEKLGGGGHMSIAGAQLTDCTTEQAVNIIKLTLDKMLDEGEI